MAIVMAYILLKNYGELMSEEILLNIENTHIINYYLFRVCIFRDIQNNWKNGFSFLSFQIYKIDIKSVQG